MNKIHDLALLLDLHKIDIAMITEVKPKYRRIEISLNELNIQGYDLFLNIETDGRESQSTF